MNQLEASNRHRLLVISSQVNTDAASRHILDVQSMLHHNPELDKFREEYYDNVVRAWNDILDLDSALRAEIKRLEGGTDGQEDRPEGGSRQEAEEEVEG